MWQPGHLSLLSQLCRLFFRSVHCVGLDFCLFARNKGAQTVHGLRNTAYVFARC